MTNNTQTIVTVRAFSTITDSYSDAPVEYEFTGRLLGACTKDEGNKIISNNAVSKRIYSKETKSIINTLAEMNTLYKQNNLNNAGRVVIAIKSINGVETQTKQLLVTDTISLIFEEAIDIAGVPNMFGIMCHDDSYITITENH